MKWSAPLLLSLVPFVFAAPVNEQVARVHTVYLLPMTNGLDQYLANRLTNLGVFQVVADPKKADAVLTDRLGAAFETRLAELYPEAPPPAPPAAKSTEKPAEPAKSAKSAEAGEKQSDEKEPGEKVESGPDFSVKNRQAPQASSFRRAKGTVFLVDAHARAILWSVYDEPKNTTAAELDRLATRIVERLKKQMAQK